MSQRLDNTSQLIVQSLVCMCSLDHCGTVNDNLSNSNIKILFVAANKTFNIVSA